MAELQGHTYTDYNITRAGCAVYKLHSIDNPLTILYLLRVVMVVLR